MKWTVALLLLLGSVAVWSSPARFDNFQIYKVQIETEEQLLALQSFTGSNQLVFLDEPRKVGQALEVIVAPHQQESFNAVSDGVGLQRSVLVDNMQKLVDREQKINPRADGYDLEKFHRLDEIYAYLDSLAVKFPTVVTRIKAGDTYEGRSIEGVKLSRNPNNPAIFIESNIHAREWITSASTNWIINELLTSTDREVAALLNNYNWYIFPVANPDGYEYTHTDYRLWRKTRSRQSLICWGTDPNRNWDFMWQAGGTGASADPCSDTFAGPSAFSESETRGLSDFALSHKSEIKAYIAFHSAARMILSPYGHTLEVPEDHDKQMQIMTAAYNRLNAVHGTVYTFGPTYETICEIRCEGVMSLVIR